MLLWAVVILDLGTLSMSLPQISDKNFTAECVREHNEARSAVSPSSSDMLYMSWDEALAVTARAWAKHCQFKHNIYLKEVQRVHPTYHSVGENIWVGTPPSHFSVKGALRSWVNEKQFYSYEANSCKGMCGHYTQVVWANSYKVGCAVQLCPNGIKHFDGREGAIFVCNYAPRITCVSSSNCGNWFGKKPYAEGNSCSKCKDICERGLCRSGERDKLRSYSWTPDWDPDNFSKNYKVILIVRPIFLILICISAYAVRYFYPDVFCYE